MKYQCMEHGELPRILTTGKTMAGYESVRPSGKDLENVVFTIKLPNGREIDPRHVSVRDSHHENYMRKFADWRVGIAEAVQQIYEYRQGYEELLCTEHHSSDHICQNMIVDEIFIPDIGDTEHLNPDYLRTGGFDGTAEVYWPVKGTEQFEHRVFDTILCQARDHGFGEIQLNISTNDTTGIKSEFDEQGYRTAIERKETRHGFGNIIARKSI